MLVDSSSKHSPDISEIPEERQLHDTTSVCIMKLCGNQSSNTFFLSHQELMLFIFAIHNSYFHFVPEQHLGRNVTGFHHPRPDPNPSMTLKLP